MYWYIHLSILVSEIRVTPCDTMWQPNKTIFAVVTSLSEYIQYIPRNMHTVFALLCFVVVIHWLIFPYPSGLLHWHCGNLTIAPVPAKQTWWIWINTSCEFIMNHCITTTKQSTTKRCAYFLGYTVTHIWNLNVNEIHRYFSVSKSTLMKLKDHMFTQQPLSILAVTIHERQSLSKKIANVMMLVSKYMPNYLHINL